MSKAVNSGCLREIVAIACGVVLAAAVAAVLIVTGVL